VVATLEEGSTDFGEVIRRLNELFGSTFQEFQHTESNVASSFKIIDPCGARERSIDNIEERVARPSEQRGRMKDALREGPRSKDLARLRADAYGLSDKLTSP
jgi:hypothetical protein